MERLTEKFVCNLPDEVLEKLGIADIPKEDYEIKGTNGELCRETCEKYECDSCPIQKVIDKLAKYEDAEEQGLLVKIECHCKDCVHWFDRVAGATEHVKLCTVGGYMVAKNGYCVYAEKALAEMKGV